IENVQNEGSMIESGFLNVLDTYMVDWNPEKISRDLWQNFYDSNIDLESGIGSLDRVTLSVSSHQETGKNQITLIGDKSFDWRSIIHFGETSKDNSDYYAGGRGEGLKIIALLLLRSNGSIKIASNDWEFEFYLDRTPEGLKTNNSSKGLFYKVKRVPQPINGCRYDITTNEKSLVNAISISRDLFNHKNNPDFINQTVSVPGVGFIKVLRKGSSGNFYLNGMRIHAKSYEWNTISGFTICFWKNENRMFNIGRDRGLIYRNDISNALKNLIDLLSPEDLEVLLMSLEEYYEESSNISEMAELKRLTISRLSSLGIKIDWFDNKYIALNSTVRINKEFLEDLGFIVCDEGFSRIGMKSVLEYLSEIEELNSTEINIGVKELLDYRLDFLSNQLLNGIEYEGLFFDARVKPIKLYKEKRPFGNLKYETDCVWMSLEDATTSDINQFINSYLSELCYSEGSLKSSEYSYCFTNLMRFIYSKLFLRPEILRNPEHVITFQRYIQESLTQERFNLEFDSIIKRISFELGKSLYTDGLSTNGLRIISNSATGKIDLESFRRNAFYFFTKLHKQFFQREIFELRVLPEMYQFLMDNEQFRLVKDNYETYLNSVLGSIPMANSDNYSSMDRLYSEIKGYKTQLEEELKELNNNLEKLKKDKREIDKTPQEREIKQRIIEEIKENRDLIETKKTEIERTDQEIARLEIYKKDLQDSRFYLKINELSSAKMEGDRYDLR
ncbi:hypothetical protein EBU91_03900, partial [bacterium]|nr:hypothetical protein [bacterium]